ncbi:MAG: hypothetical protein IPM48_01730 [Saprospiraceae bacterium]|nr:hypothetical protein [Saprospiraceae bacterium]
MAINTPCKFLFLQSCLVMVAFYCQTKSLYAQDLTTYPKIVQYNDSIQIELWAKDSANGFSILKELKQGFSKKRNETLSIALEILEFRYLMLIGVRHDSLLTKLNLLLQNAECKKIPGLNADALQAAGHYYWEGKSHGKAIEYYLYANQIYSKLSLAEYPHKIDHLKELANKFYFYTDYTTAKNYLLELFDLYPKDQMNKHISNINTLGLCYFHLQKYDSAEYYLNVAENIAAHSKEEAWIGIISGNKAQIYFYQGKQALALPLFEKDAALSLKKKNNQSAALSLTSCAAIYLDQKENEKALKTAIQAKQIIDQKINKTDYHFISKSYPTLARIYSIHGKVNEAYQMIDSALLAKDSLTKQKNLLYLMGAQHKVNAEKHLYELLNKENELSKQKLIRNGLLFGSLSFLLMSAVLFLQRNRIKKEKARTEELLLNILPEEVANELKEKGSAEAKMYDEVTVMFTDFKDFTKISENLSPQELVADIHSYFEAFDKIISKYPIEKIKTIGDSYMCAGGLPIRNQSHPVDIIHAALELLEYVRNHQRNSNQTYNIRIGVNTGPVVAGIVGLKKFAYDIWGDTVNIASRLESTSDVGKINISGVTYELVKDYFHCTYRGKVEVKNKGMIDMYFVEGKIVPSSVGSRED